MRGSTAMFSDAILSLGQRVSEMFLQNKDESQLWYNWNQRLFRRRWRFSPLVQEVEGICVWNLASTLRGKKADSKVYSRVCESWKVFDKRETVPVCESKSHENRGEFCFVCMSHRVKNVKGGWFSSKKLLPLSASMFPLSERSPRGLEKAHKASICTSSSSPLKCLQDPKLPRL